MNFKIFKNLKINIVHDYVLLLKKKKIESDSKSVYKNMFANNSEYLEQKSVLK